MRLLKRYPLSGNSNDSFVAEQDDKPEFAVEPKLFGRWSYEGVQSPDNSLSNYL